MNYTRRLTRLALALLFCFLQIAAAYSQGKNVSGAVTSANGDALPGLSVMVKGTTTGAVTDLDGKYSVTVPNEEAILVFSYVGYATQEIIVGAQTSINVTMQEEATSLDEVVVVGYGTQQAKEVTGAVTSVKSENFNDGNINDPMQLIQGKVAGLSIAKPGGDPNAEFNIRLRGLSTFGSNTQPLIVVDGVQGVSLNSVDPNDIASMDVLKDASASAIYGTKGASGVIIITTKKGKKGTADRPVNVDYSGSYTITTIDKKLDVLSKDDYLTFASAVDYGSETNWMDEITRTGGAQSHNLSIGGASENSVYRVSLNYRDNEGVVKKTGFDQVSGRLNFSQYTLQKMLKFDVNLSMNSRNEQYSPREALLATIKYNPTAPIYDSTKTQYGGYFQENGYQFYNPVAMINQSTLNGRKNSIIGSFKATLEPIKNLQIYAFYSVDYDNEYKNDYWSKFAQFPDDVNGVGKARKESKYFFKKMFESVAKYEYTNTGFTGSVLVGYSWQESLGEGFWAEAKKFISDGFSYNDLGAGSDRTLPDPMDSWKNKSTLIGAFANMNLKYNDTYFLTLNYRKDGSSMFGENNKWGNFYGVSGGIDFAKFLNISWLNRIKPRGGIGTTGNLPKESYFSMDLYEPGESFYYDGGYSATYKPIRNLNPNLKWEVKKETNIGFDYSLFSYRLSGNIDYFTSKSSDLLLLFSVPTTNNIAAKTWMNVGELKNSGVEFAVNWEAVKRGDFSWSTDFNVTRFFETTLEKITNNKEENSGELLTGELGAPGYVGVTTIKLYQGEPIGQIIGPHFEGVVDGKFTYGTDTLNLGTGLPKFQMGWGNTVKYKSFDLSFFFRGVFGHSLINTNNLRYGSPTTISMQNGMNIAKEFKDVVGGAPRFSDRYVEKADFIKLDNFAVGYTFSTTNSKYISKVRAYVAGQNIFTFTKYTGTSPEVRYTDTQDLNNPDPLAPGIDRGDTYFSTRSFTFGANITF
jgi:TonB-linked SusC/RagA family outer membrane protein